MRSVEDFHIRERGMSTVAYSWIIMPSGRVYEGRGWGRAGGHTFSFKFGSFNSISHAICFAGFFHPPRNQRPTFKAVAAFHELVEQGVRRGKIPKNAVAKLRGHTDVGAEKGPTACPGNHLMAILDELREGTMLTPEQEQTLKEAKRFLDAIRQGLQPEGDPVTPGRAGNEVARQMLRVVEHLKSHPRQPS